MKTLCIAILALILAAPLSAQNPGVIAGQVVERGTGRPIPTATVDVTTPEGAHRSTRTDSAGRYRISDVPAGRLSLRVRSIGYSPAVADSLRVSPGGSVTQNFTLGAIAEVLQQERGGDVTPRPRARP